MFRKLSVKILKNLQLLCFLVGRLSYIFYPPSCCKIINSNINSFYSGRVSKRFKECGKNLYVNRKIKLWHPERIFVGNFVQIHQNAILATHSKNAVLRIEDGVTIGEYCHITCINRIHIEENVLMGKKCIITDNNHGRIDYESLQMPPDSREVEDGGNVIIKKNVWLGDNVVILPNVTIGEGCIIGASTVVTKSMPAYSICVGNPARIIKSFV